MSFDHRRHDHDPQLDDLFVRLEHLLRRDGPILEALTSSFEPLTLDQIEAIDPILRGQAEQVAATAISWPDEQTAVPIAPDSFICRLSGDDADQEFVLPIIAEGETFYNNFYVNIRTKYETPSEEVAHRHMTSGAPKSLNDLGNGSKPYLGRAYALVPEFMGALQAATDAHGSIHTWHDDMLAGYLEPEMNRDKAALLRGSRLAYVLLARLMRRDDRKIQFAMLRLPTDTVSEITDPIVELRT